MDFQETMVASHDGTKLRLVTLDPTSPAGPPVLIVHGLGEHSGRFRHVMQHLAGRGFLCGAVDLRGHGKSEGRRGDAMCYADLLGDLRAAAECFCGGTPFFLYAHSFGGQVAIHALLAGLPGVQGMVLTSPWLDLAFQPPRWKLLLAQLARRAMPGLIQQTGLSLERLGRDIDFLKTMPELELVHHRISVRLYHALTAAAAKARARAREFSTPFLLIHGEADDVTSDRASSEFFQKSSAQDKTLCLLPGVRHEPHNDFGREEVLEEIAQWLSARCVARHDV